MANAIHIAEDHIIGGCLKDAYIADVIIAELEPIDFSHPTNRCIFNILLKLYKDNKHIDAITVFSLAQDLGFDVSLEHLNELQTQTHEGVGHYLELVKESSRRRKAQATLNEAQRMLEDGDESSTVIEFIEKEMFSIMNTKVAKDFIKVGDSVDEAFEDIKMMRESSSHVMGLSTGYQELDLKTSGFHPGELIILAARPGIGKTSLAVNMASNI
jgi:replicative DNA helicase